MSIGSPAPASGAPAARCAATGAKRSRPWKVADVGSRRCGERATSTASTAPPKRSTASASRPLSGPDEDALVLGGAHRHGAALAADLGVDDREVHAGREVGQRAAQHERAGAHVVAIDAVR